MQSYPPSQERSEQPPEGAYQPQQARPEQPPEGTYQPYQQPQPGYQQPQPGYQQTQPQPGYQQPYQQGYPQPYQQPGYPQQYPPAVPYGAQQKDWLMTLLLCIFTGIFGVHRFYTGHIAIGVVQLLTAGGCGIWTLVDLIMIVTDNYKDANGLPLRKAA